MRPGYSVQNLNYIIISVSNSKLCNRVPRSVYEFHLLLIAVQVIKAKVLRGESIWVIGTKNSTQGTLPICNSTENVSETDK